MRGVKLKFEEVAEKVRAYKPDYELIELLPKYRLKLKYLPTGEIFERSKLHFFRDSAHAPSIRNQIKLQKAIETSLEKYGVENVFQSEDIKAKIRKTNLEKYGVESITHSMEFKSNVRKTNLERYGVEYTFQNEEIKAKIKKTNLTRYGVEHNQQNKEIREKTAKTNLERYGVSNLFYSSEVQTKIKEMNRERYGVENPWQREDVKIKIKEINLKKYGVENPSQNEEVKSKFRKTNLEKYGVEYPSQNEDVKAKVKETRMDKGLTSHINRKTIVEIAKEKGVGSYALLLAHRAGIDIDKIKRKNSSLPEQFFKSILIDMNLEFETQKRFKGFGNRSVDFYLASHNLVIEINGIWFHSTTYRPDKNFHYQRRLDLNLLGLKVIQFTDQEVINSSDFVRQVLKDSLDGGNCENSFIKDDLDLIVDLNYADSNRLNEQGYHLISEWVGFKDYKAGKFRVYDCGNERWRPK